MQCPVCDHLDADEELTDVERRGPWTIIGYCNVHGRITIGIEVPGGFTL